MEWRSVRTGNRIKQRVEQDEDEVPAAAQLSPRGQHGRLEQPEVGNSLDPLRINKMSAYTIIIIIYQPTWEPLEGQIINEHINIMSNQLYPGSPGFHRIFSGSSHLCGLMCCYSLRPS